MKRLLQNPSVAARLRRFKPLYYRLTGRHGVGPGPDAAEMLRRLDGRGLFLFSFGRSGTTVFRNFAATHPQIEDFGEVLNEEAFHGVFRRLGGRAVRPSVFRARFYAHLARLVARNPGCICLFDMKFESLHLIEGNWRLPGPDFEILHAVRESGAPAILIERRDAVGRHVSLQLAIRRNRFHSFEIGTEEAPDPFEIDIPALEREIRVIRAQHARVRQIFAGAPRFLDLAYEEMFVRAEDGAQRFSPEIGPALSRLLDIDARFDPAPRLERVGATGRGDPVRNRSEVEAVRARHGG
ncbi:MAG: hypothetical protein ACFBRM_03425 [Pikeienuella sp.]